MPTKKPPTEAADDRERHPQDRLARHRRQLEADRRRQAEQRARVDWYGTRHTLKWLKTRRRRA